MMFLEQFLIGNLWNAALICVILGVKHLLRGRISLRFQFHVWYILLFSLLLCFVPVGIWPKWSGVGNTGRQAFAISSAASNAANDTVMGIGWLQDTADLMVNPNRQPFAQILWMIWLVGVLTFAMIYWCGSSRLRRLKQSAVEQPCEIQTCFEACCRKIGLKQNVELRQSGYITAPMSFGWRKAFVVLPRAGAESLSEAELEHIFLHELTHIRHGDLITNSLFCGVQVLFWFNPLVWLAFGRMRRDREAYCDWSVLSGLADEAERMDYGQTLLRFAAGSNIRFHTANGFCQSIDQLKYRLERIVDFQRETKWKRFMGFCVSGALVLAAIGQIPIFACCAENNAESYKPSDMLTMVEADWGIFFDNIDGCAVVYDWNADVFTVYNKAEVTHRVPPCSTYKIYSALNALELGIITAEENTVSWDGTTYSFESWNQQQSLRSAMKESVNWYFQGLDQAAGAERMEAFFEEIGYGDCDPGSSPDSYWNGSGLKISALEQVELLVKLYRNDFGFDNANIAAVKDAMALDSSGLYGKTGTGRLDDANVAGWFIGYVDMPDNAFFIAVYLNSQDGADGKLAYETAVRILEEYNYSK